jgi:hypothetical protein
MIFSVAAVYDRRKLLSRCVWVAKESQVLAKSSELVNSSHSDRAVAQLGSALEWGSRGRGFKSRRPDSFNTACVESRRSSCSLTKVRNQRIAGAFLGTGFAVLCAVLPVAGKDSENIRSAKLNTNGLTYAKELISGGHVVLDQKGAWAKDRPSTELENEFIRQHGFSEYAKWHLGIDERYPENTKRRYKFPYGDFKNVHRCGLLAVKARARQYRHTDIENAAAQLERAVENRPNNAKPTVWRSDSA